MPHLQALFSCEEQVDWVITFCPGPDTFDTKVQVSDRPLPICPTCKI